MNILRKKKGFTLVEILVVIMIIGVLSTLAVNGYTQYRRSTLLDFSIENLMAEMDDLRGKTIRADLDEGRVEEIKDVLEDGGSLSEGSGGAKCYGIEFKKNGDVYDVYTFSEKFDSKKEFSVVKGEWGYVGCGGDRVENKMDFDEMFVVEEVSDLEIKFAPPNGKLVGLSGEGEVKIRYGTEESRHRKKLIIDYTNLTYKVEN